MVFLFGLDLFASSIIAFSPSRAFFFYLHVLYLMFLSTLPIVASVLCIIVLIPPSLLSHPHRFYDSGRLLLIMYIY